LRVFHSAAQEKLLKSYEDQKESFDNTSQRNPVVEEGQIEQLETAPLDNVADINLEEEDNSDFLAIEEPIYQQPFSIPMIETPDIPSYEQAMTISEFSLSTPVPNIPPSNRDFEEETDKKQKTDRQPATVGNKSCGSCNIM